MKTLRVDFSDDTFEELEKIRYQFRIEDNKVPTPADVLGLALGMLTYLVDQKKSKKILIAKDGLSEETKEFDFAKGWNLVWFLKSSHTVELFIF